MAKKKKKVSAKTKNNKKTQATKLSTRQQALLAEAQKKFDPKVTAQQCIDDINYVQDNHCTGGIGRDLYRIWGKYSDRTWGRHFGSWTQFKREAGLMPNKDVTKLENQLAKHVHHDIYKKYYIEKIAPYNGKYEKKGTASRMKTLLVGSDFHDIDSDPFVLSVFIDTAKRIQPDIIILNGDVFDEYEFSRFHHDPREYNIVERVKFVGERIFAPLRKACPNAQIDFIIGNHEFRLFKLLANEPMLRILLSDVVGLRMKDLFHPQLDKYQINLVSKLDLDVFTKSEEDKELKNNYQVYYDCFVATHIQDWGFGLSGTSGHTHKPKFDYQISVPMGRMTWMVTASIAKIRAHYVDGLDRYANGFGIVHIDTLTRSVIQEPILIPDQVAIVAGKYYFRSNVEE